MGTRRLTQGALLLQVTGKAESAAKKTADKAESATKDTADKAESKTADKAESATKKSANGTSDSVVCISAFSLAHMRKHSAATHRLHLRCLAQPLLGLQQRRLLQQTELPKQKRKPAQKATQLCWERSLHGRRYRLALRTAPTATMMPLQDSAAEEAQAMVRAI